MTDELGPGPVLSATINLLNKRRINPAVQPLAAAALRLASVIDGARSPRDVSDTSRELRAVLVALNAAAPAKPEVDPVDEIAKARAARRAKAKG